MAFLQNVSTNVQETIVLVCYCHFQSCKSVIIKCVKKIKAFFLPYFGWNLQFDPFIFFNE